MRIFALLAVISLIAACSWRVAPGRSDDPRLTDWCPTSEICIPEADIERFSIPAYAIQQSTLPTEFAMRAGADFGVRDDAVMIAIYPTPSEDMIKFEAIPSQGGEIYEQVLYDEKFGNLITWRVMARSHGRRGGYF